MSEAGILFKRYVWLINTVKSGRLTKDDILQKWADNYSLNERPGERMADKTFHNHVNAIASIFGLRIRCNKYGDKTYYIESENDGDEFSGLKEWLVDTLSVSNTVAECSELRGRIRFENIPSGQKWLTLIIQAMKDSHPVEMTYEGFWGRGAHTFVVRPYFVKVFKQRWYLIAYSVGDMQIRCYALDRIKAADVQLDSIFSMPLDFRPDDYFKDCYGIIHGDDEEVETVRIRVTGRQAKYVESLPLHSSQLVEEGGSDECRIFRYRIKPTFDFIQEVFSHADDFEVLEPQWLRDEIGRRVRLMCRRYDTTPE